jgi:hypothetical protein
MSNKSLSEIDLVSIIEKVIDMNRWTFKLTYSNSREYASGYPMQKVIYDSEWCRVLFAAYQRRSTPPDMHDVYIRYGRLHAPDESENDLMIWQGEKCHCWHSVGSLHLYFIEGFSPSEALNPPILQVFREARSSAYDKIRSELGEFFPIVREAVIWNHYGLRLFELFDLSRPDLWNKYVKFLEEYYQLQADDYKSKGMSSSETQSPPLWKVC